MYHEGDGVNQDSKTAMQYLKMAGVCTLHNSLCSAALVGDTSNRREQAKLMWKALESNDRATFEQQAAELQTISAPPHRRESLS